MCVCFKLKSRSACEVSTHTHVHTHTHTSLGHGILKKKKKESQTELAAVRNFWPGLKLFPLHKHKQDNTHARTHLPPSSSLSPYPLPCGSAKNMCHIAPSQQLKWRTEETNAKLMDKQRITQSKTAIKRDRDSNVERVRESGTRAIRKKFTGFAKYEFKPQTKSHYS